MRKASHSQRYKWDPLPLVQTGLIPLPVYQYYHGQWQCYLLIINLKLSDS